MTMITGRVGSRLMGYDVNLSGDSPDQGGPLTLSGRIGSGLIARPLVLSVAGPQVTGRLGGAMLGQNLKLRLGDHTLTGRVGGERVGSDVRLDSSATSLSGQYGGAAMGFGLSFDLRPGEVTGRLGGKLAGADAALRGDTSPLLLALVAALAYECLQQDSAAAM